MTVAQDELKVVIGAGEYNNNPGWIHTQESELDLLNKETWNHRFKPNSLKSILAEHVWEHLTLEEGITAAKICYDFLKPGGHIRIAVPDAFFPDESYQDFVKVGGPGPKDHPAASHKIVYNYHTLSEVFKTSGFKVVLLEYCDDKGTFHHHEWLAEDGVIFRSKKYDPRNQGEQIVCPSLMIDAIKK
ncbi:class I SAM-dependent methyltransferase [Chengkuizengella axinellae]|uniref:SAM-dependent methyltransferase n=1 Tax=Chengkuizengella axinellae TaxID=3064388 RepID=A0ABT9J177_9BACL|nr:SAM-dependent methyltransferase [Chengkuizengella sp. 2205SS18-9]MDP5274770.1 SAM-dependent methyltransferase [Chengkuizengella sp. 2205SS18-9]